jgi:hypothetical protein
MKATNALVAAAVAGVLAAGTSMVSAALPTEHAISAEKKKDDCPNKDKKEKDDCPSKDKKEKDDCPGKDKEKKKEGTIL